MLLPTFSYSTYQIQWRYPNPTWAIEGKLPKATKPMLPQTYTCAVQANQFHLPLLQHLSMDQLQTKEQEWQVGMQQQKTQPRSSFFFSVSQFPVGNEIKLGKVDNCSLASTKLVKLFIRFVLPINLPSGGKINRHQGSYPKGCNPLSERTHIALVWDNVPKYGCQVDKKYGKHMKDCVDNSNWRWSFVAVDNQSNAIVFFKKLVLKEMGLFYQIVIRIIPTARRIG